MDQNQMFMMLPGIQPEELMAIQNLIKDMTAAQQQQFYAIYQGKRKEQQTLMLLTLLGFFGIAGIQRFVLGEAGMGILYFLTLGFCGIGTIIDIFNIRNMTAQYNLTKAYETAQMVKMMMK